jgi:G3E family GTPase
MAASQPIPVTIIAGFLGAGKTTLLNRILKADHGRRIAVLVNDFGQVNIDTQLLDSAGDDQIIDLPNGCICCTLARDLAGVVRGVIGLEDPPEQLIVEASGVSSPADIESILDVPELASRIRVSSIITLVDAENALRLARAVMFADKQIAAADIVVVNKIDLVEANHLANVLAWISSIAPAAHIVQTTQANVPLGLITGNGPRGISDRTPLVATGHTGHDHGQEFRSWAFTTNEAFSRDRLQSVINDLPAAIYRAKGFLYFGDDPDRRYMLHVVGRRVTILEDIPWGEQEPLSQLVFIGERDRFEPAGLEADLSACIT